MLGFSTFSETPFSQGITSAFAIAFMDSTYSQGYTGLIDYDAKATVVPFSVTATLVANPFGDVDAKATIAVTEALASFSINDLLDVDAQATILPASVIATFVATDFADVDAKAHTTISTISSVITASDIDFDAKASITKGSVSASIQANGFSDVDAKANITPSPVTAVFALDIYYDAKAITTLGTPTLLTTAINDLTDIDAQAAASISGVNLQSNNSAFDAIMGSANTYVTGVYADTEVDLDDPEAIRFPYQADAYDRSRTIYVISYDNNDSVYVIDQNYTVFIDKPYVNNVVYVETQDTTVYIDARSQQNTVYIAA